MMSDSENRDSGLRLTGRWYALALLALTLVLSMTTWLSASAVIPQLRAEWDLSDNAAAWLTIAVQLCFSPSGEGACTLIGPVPCRILDMDFREFLY